ncbi:MAG: cytidine deaminase [Bacillota bacterium]|nr:cytidine deaminase [Bacillota bacterium]
MDRQALIEQAAAARQRAYAPYSRMTVGAALLCGDGRIFCGCNIENAAFAPSLCAERVAFAQAIAAGCREFRAIAVSGGPAGQPSGGAAEFAPCGVCRQMMAEFCADDFVILVGGAGSGEFTLAELLPHKFGPEQLG